MIFELFKAKNYPVFLYINLVCQTLSKVIQYT